MCENCIIVFLLEQLIKNITVEGKQMAKEDKANKNKRNMGRIAARVLAIILALLMVAAVVVTLVYYLI